MAAAQWSEETNRKRSESMKGRHQKATHVKKRTNARKAKGSWFKDQDIGTRIRYGKYRAKLQRMFPGRDIYTTGHYRGHPTIAFEDEQKVEDNFPSVLRYVDDLTEPPGNGTGNGVERPCIACHRLSAPEEPDPCLGWLDGVKFACCGHGTIHNHPYVWFESGRYLSGEAAIAFFRSRGCIVPNQR